MKLDGNLFTRGGILFYFNPLYFSPLRNDIEYLGISLHNWVDPIDHIIHNLIKTGVREWN